jgi:hypothetical protein
MDVPEICEACVSLNSSARANGWPMRCDCASNIAEPRLRALWQLWRMKAADGIPKRSAFDMRSLAPFVKHLVILERLESEGTRRYKFRLFGSAHMFLFGDHTGRYLDEMVAAELRPSWQAYYDAVLSAHKPMRVVTQFRLRSGDMLESEVLAAPLRDESGDERLVLAATFVDLSNVARAPF